MKKEYIVIEGWPNQRSSSREWMEKVFEGLTFIDLPETKDYRWVDKRCGHTEGFGRLDVVLVTGTAQDLLKWADEKIQFPYIKRMKDEGAAEHEIFTKVKNHLEGYHWHT
jgi:hypothetical protein